MTLKYYSLEITCHKKVLTILLFIIFHHTKFLNVESQIEKKMHSSHCHYFVILNFLKKYSYQFLSRKYFATSWDRLSVYSTEWYSQRVSNCKLFNIGTSKVQWCNSFKLPDLHTNFHKIKLLFQNWRNDKYEDIEIS
jgi:hypothetical protein